MGSASRVRKRKIERGIAEEKRDVPLPPSSSPLSSTVSVSRRCQQFFAAAPPLPRPSVAQQPKVTTRQTYSLSICHCVCFAPFSFAPLYSPYNIGPLFAVVSLSIFLCPSFSAHGPALFALRARQIGKGRYVADSTDWGVAYIIGVLQSPFHY